MSTNGSIFSEQATGTKEEFSLALSDSQADSFLLVMMLIFSFKLSS
jgi:hypothetical protein